MNCGVQVRKGLQATLVGPATEEILVGQVVEETLAAQGLKAFPLRSLEVRLSRVENGVITHSDSCFTTCIFVVTYIWLIFLIRFQWGINGGIDPPRRSH